VKVRFLGGGQYADDVWLKVHPVTADAFRALAAVFRNFNYSYNERAGGTCVCRKITGGRRSSLHAHGIALDINPSANGYRRAAGPIQWGRHTDMSPAMITAVEAIRTKTGRRVFEWGGRWTNIKDAMHFQVRVSQSDLKSGIDWDTVGGVPDMEDEMVLKKGDSGNAVRLFQQALNTQGAGEGLTADGDFGSLTEAAEKRYQGAAQVDKSGVIDGVTAALLVRYTGGP